MHKPRVISQVVNNDLCIGCGACTYACTSDSLTMTWNDEGFRVAELIGDCNDDGNCINVCPFNPMPFEAVKDETAIADVFLDFDTHQEYKLGRLINIYAGYSHKYRETSSSGGLATYVFESLLKQGIVDHIFAVSASDNSSEHYQYRVISNVDQIIQSSKTKYYPVTLSSVLDQIDHLEGKVAVVGVACFVKAIRLAQYHHPHLKEKIPFIIGIICGGIKSKFFTEYLASKAGAYPKTIIEPQYRVKDKESYALDYSFSCIDTSKNEYKRIKMREVGDMWGTGLFKANACDYCDDVVTELADISLGDAWLKPYDEDGRGTSLVITRSPIAQSIINKGIEYSELNLESINPDTMRKSQQGSFNHRHEGLYVRLKEAEKKNLPIANKRYGQEPVSRDVVAVQKLRRVTRKKSLTIWRKYKVASEFDKKMNTSLNLLKVATRFTRYRRAIIKRVNKVLK